MSRRGAYMAEIFHAPSRNARRCSATAPPLSQITWTKHEESRHRLLASAAVASASPAHDQKQAKRSTEKPEPVSEQDDQSHQLRASRLFLFPPSSSTSPFYSPLNTRNTLGYRMYTIYGPRLLFPGSIPLSVTSRISFSPCAPPCPLFRHHALHTGSSPCFRAVHYKIEVRVLEYASYSPHNKSERKLDPPE
jgi:hypothetical protein